MPHNTLLNKIHHLKIPSIILCWLISYLMNRFQRVVFKGCSSTWLPVRSGVPQGSILGPLLFLLYMNDISDVPLTPGTKLFLFADDILLFKPIKSDSDFCDFQKDIDAISNWTVANHLTLNANKTKVMLISRNRKSQCPSFSLNGIQIEKVRHFKYLGIWLSDDLTWSKHIESVCCKARRVLGYIYRTFSPHCSTESILHLYKTQVLPIWTHTSRRTRYFWRASNTLQFELPPSLGPVTTLVPHMTYHLLNDGDSTTNYFIPLNF